MLWSLLKIVIFVCVVAALAVGADFLLGLEGGIRVEIPGVGEANMSPIMSVIAICVLVLAVWLLLKLFGLLVACWKFVSGDETAISRFFARNREARGYEALTQGLVALASGEGRLAMAKAEKAERYLGKPELTNLLTAQAAELSGETKKAEQTYRKLLQNDKTRFVGVRGILMQKLSEGDTETALKLAQKAFALKPRHDETQDTLLRLQAQKQDWAGASETLNAKLKHGALPRDVYKRRDAILELCKAKALLAEENTAEARAAAISANKKSPDLIPAAVMAAEAHITNGQTRQATKILTKAWGTQPHPELARVFALIEPEETPQERLARFSALTKQNPEDSETKMLLTELHLVAEDFPGARRSLDNLFESEPSVRAATLMAAIEKGEGSSEEIVQGWLTRALNAPRGPQWVCDNCGHIYTEWQPLCDECGAFDSLTWKQPVLAEASDSSAQMLPLLVGKPDEQAENPVAIVEPEIDATVDGVVEGEATPVSNGADTNEGVRP